MKTFPDISVYPVIETVLTHYDLTMLAKRLVISRYFRVQ